MNRYVTIWLLQLLITGFVSNAATGDTIRVTTLESLYKLAIQHNATQKVYDLKREQTGYDYKASNSYLYPQMNGSFGGQDNLKLATTPVPGELLGQPGKTIYLQFGKKYVYNAGFNITENIFNWQLVLQAQLSKQNKTLNDLQQVSFEQSLKTQIGQYYYSLLIARASLEISQKDLVLADSVTQLIKQRFQQGLTDASAVNNALIDYNNVQQNIFQSEELIKQSLSGIRIQTGMAYQDTLIVVNPENNIVEDYPLQKQFNLGEDRTLLVYPQNIKLAELQKKAQQAALLPSLSVGAYYGFQQFGNDLSLSIQKGTWLDYQYLSLNLNLPIFTGFNTSNKIKSMDVQKRIAIQQYRDACDQSKINDDALRDSYDSYLKMTQTSRQTFQLYAKNVELSLEKFREGMISIDSYFKTFQEYLTAENNYLTNLSNLLAVQASVDARK